MSIEIKNLTTYSEDKQLILDNVSFKIDTGDFASIIGHTGSGKSTLVQHIKGLIAPDKGKVYIYGHDIHRTKKDTIKYTSNIGLIFQYPEHQLFETSIYREVAFGPMNMGIKGKELDEAVSEALELVGVSSSMYDRPSLELSGGQKRRVAIASIIAMKPKILILDEPTAGLDPLGAKQILGKIKSLHTLRNQITILISHNMNDVAELSNKVIVLNKGKIMYHGTPYTIFSKIEHLESIGLFGPDMAYLQRELISSGIDIEVEDYKINTMLTKLKEYFKSLVKEDKSKC